MRVAIISDIHANMHALEEVVKDIDTQKCHKVWCLGDLVLAGPQPVRTMQYMLKQDKWVIIQGNTDKMIANYNPEIAEFLSEQYPVMANAMEADCHDLTDKYRAYLSTLPPQYSINVEGTNVLLVHGSPRANNEDILPDQPLEKIEEIISGTKEKLIFCGHTHIPCGYQTRAGQTVVNVGSVGRPMTKQPQACYVVADFHKDGTFEIKHRFVPYDNVTAASIMSRRDFIGADKIADLLLNPGARHI